MSTIKRTWWIWEDHLLGGMFPMEILEDLIAEDFSVFIQLQEENETNREGQSFPEYESKARTMAKKLGKDPDELIFKRFPIKDMSIPSIKTMYSILDTIDKYLQMNKKVYIHCWGGHGRTGTVASCWMARKWNMEDTEIYDIISKQRQHDPLMRQHSAPQRPVQKRFVAKFIGHWNNTKTL